MFFLNNYFSKIFFFRKKRKTVLIHRRFEIADGEPLPQKKAELKVRKAIPLLTKIIGLALGSPPLPPALRESPPGSLKWFRPVFLVENGVGCMAQRWILGSNSKLINPKLPAAKFFMIQEENRTRNFRNYLIPVRQFSFMKNSFPLHITFRTFPLGLTVLKTQMKP